MQEWRSSEGSKGSARNQSQKLDCFEQTTVAILTYLEHIIRMMGGTNRDHEKEERNLPRDLPQGRPNSEPIPELYEIPFYDGRFSKKRFIN